MRRTYEVYLHHPRGQREFVVLTCHHAEVITRAGEILRASEAVRAEICEAGQPLYTIDRESR